MSMSADETGSAVVCSGYRGGCRRVYIIVIVQREQGRMALTLCNCSSFIVSSFQLSVSREIQKRFARNGGGGDVIGGRVWPPIGHQLSAKQRRGFAQLRCCAKGAMVGTPVLKAILIIEQKGYDSSSSFQMKGGKIFISSYSESLSSRVCTSAGLRLSRLSSKPRRAAACHVPRRVGS